jgi:HTH-type transcriptional regulator, sugar sensing transcriptional regulator
MVVNKVISKLLKIGFSEYEARAYTGLLKNNPVTAYELSKMTGIPSSKIYQVTAKLVERGIVQFIGSEDKKRYIPLMPDKMLEEYRTSTEMTLNELKSDFSEIKNETEVSYVWNVNDYGKLLFKAERLILESKKTLLISIWKEEMELLYEILQKAYKKNIKIAVIHYGQPEKKIGQIFQHPIENTIYQEKGGRQLVIISDSRESLTGTIYDNSRVEGAWSMNNGFVMLAEDYVKHDIYIMKIVERFDELLIKTFGEEYNMLRNIYSDEQVNIDI